MYYYLRMHWCIFTPLNISIMSRQSITLANQDDEWLTLQVENEEFTVKVKL